MKAIKTIKPVSTIRQRIASFNQDERGMETLQIVLIVAVAAIILALIVNQWPNIKTWAQNAIQAVTNFKT
jgi:ABC-type microcin C transport system permease subunit YejE